MRNIDTAAHGFKTCVPQAKREQITADSVIMKKHKNRRNRINIIKEKHRRVKRKNKKRKCKQIDRKRKKNIERGRDV